MAIKRRVVEDTELNLAALIDIFSIMLFFLMTTVTFLTLKTLNASVPAAAKKGESVDTKDGVNVSLEIKTEGYVLKASGQPENRGASRLNIDKIIPRDSDGQLKTKKLTEELWEIKKVASEVKAIMLFPEDGTKFQDVISTMDASRDMPSIIDPKKRVQLFPRPVLSELAK
jgi:biopolymer transport protein ExbD